MALRAARTAGLRVDEVAEREQLATIKAELGLQQEQLLQGIDLFGSQVLIPYLFGLAEAGYPSDATTDSAVADLITLQRRRRKLEPGPRYFEGADSGKQHCQNRSGGPYPAVLWSTGAPK